MNLLRLVRRAPTCASIVIDAFSLHILILVVGSCAVVAAQSVTPRPVARLIEDMPNNSRARRVHGPADNGPASPATASKSPSIDEATSPERRAFEVTNEFRAGFGLAPLVWDPELCLLARSHSRNMAVLGFFSHQTPEGLRLRDRARVARIRYQVIGENIAYNQGYDDPGAFAVERWKISAGHRENLLSTEFRGSAIGSFVAPDGTVYLTQLFILR